MSSDPIATSDCKYWAFISYSHQDNLATRADGTGDHLQWANWLHEQLETYRIPAAYRDRTTRTGEPMPERFFPAFRDEAELPTSHDLSGQIRDALRLSRFLIVIASPRSARSRYVNEEIRYFRELGRGDRILVLITDGEPNVRLQAKSGWSPEDECFCPALVHPLRADGLVDETVLLAEEPIAADTRIQDTEPPREMRRAESAQPARRALLESTKLKLLAGLMGVGLDELVRRDEQRQLEEARSRAKTLRRWLAAVGVLALAALGAAGLALWQRNVARTQRERAEEQTVRAQHARSQAEDLIVATIKNVGEKLQPFGRLDLLMDSLDAVARYDQASDGALTPAQRRMRADLLALRSRAHRSLKQFKEAVAAAEASCHISEQLVKESPSDEDNRAYFGQSLGALSQPQIDLKDFPAARATIDRMVAFTKESLAANPKSVQFASQAAWAYNQLGNIEQAQGRFQESLEPFKECERRRSEILKADPNDLKSQEDVARSYATLAWIYGKLQQPEQITKLYEQAVAFMRHIAVSDPERMDHRYRLATYLGLLTDARVVQQESALESAREAAEIMAELVQRDPRNAEWKENAAYAFGSFAVQERREGRDASERAWLEKAIALEEEIVRQTPDNDLVQARLRAHASLVAASYRGIGDHARARTYVEKARRIAEQRVSEKSDDPRRSEDLAADTALLASILEESGAAEEARQTRQAAWKLYDALVKKFPDRPENAERLSELGKALGNPQ